MLFKAVCRPNPTPSTIFLGFSVKSYSSLSLRYSLSRLKSKSPLESCPENDYINPNAPSNEFLIKLPVPRKAPPTTCKAPLSLFSKGNLMKSFNPLPIVVTSFLGFPRISVELIKLKKFLFKPP